MSVSQLKEIVLPSGNDFLYIVDIDGGSYGRPRTRKITVQNLLNGLTEIDNSNIAIPTIINTSANDNDYVFMIDINGNPYKITKANLLAGLNNQSGSSGSSGTGGTSANANILLSVLFNGTNGNTTFTDLAGTIVEARGNAAAASNNIYNQNSTLLLNGNTANYVAVLDTKANLSSLDNFFIEAAIYLSSEGGDKSICSNIPGIGNRGFNFAINQSRQLYFQSDGANPTIQSSLIVSLNQWSVVKISKTGNDYRFNINNNTELISNNTSWQPSSRTDLFIGRTTRNDYPFPFQGNIAYIKIEKT